MTGEIIITRPFIGLCCMQVCAPKDATNEEVLAVCNAQNPSGTTNGWVLVVREGNEAYSDAVPVACDDDPDRVHLIVAC